jgi:hypothetical protein
MSGGPLSEPKRRKLLLAAGVYAVSTAIYLVFAAPSTLREHTPFNHFALQAEAWLRGRLDLGGPPPSHTANNDFSRFDGKWFVPFPPFPALLLLPAVAFSGSAQAVVDGRFFLLLAGATPALLFLALEKLSSRSGRSQRENLLLAFAFAFGSVYFFCAEQGTVWYAAHVVGTALAALYLLAALDAERPLLAGSALALGFATRTPLLFAFPLFFLELLRVRHPAGLSGFSRVSTVWRELDRRGFLRDTALFVAPIAAVFALTLWHNAARFGDPFEVGYRYLDVVWRARIEKWGLFSYHYLGRNLGVVTSSLPWLGSPEAPIRISGHGLALWLTTPAYFWLLWPRRMQAPHLALLLTAAFVAIPTLLYQNTGWVQFGYRFSNDYAVFLFALLAVGGRRFGLGFWAVTVFAVVVNVFGALTFDRAAGAGVYVIERSQRVYEPD